MADTNTSVSAISTDNLEIDSYDDVVKLLGADVAASMLADVAGNRFNRDDIKKAILNGGDIHLDYWPDYEEYDYAACVCGELLADTSLEWAEGFIDAEKIETHEWLTVSDLSHAVECVLTDKFNDGLYEASLVDRTEIADTFAREIKSRLGDAPKPAPGFFLPPNRPPRPVVCLDTGETFESAFQAGRAFGIAAGAVRASASTGVERNGLHFYYGDEPKPGSEFFRERHSKTRPIVCLETGETFDGNPAAARPLHVSPAAISQAVRDGSPVAGLHFYHGDEPKPAPEFFKPVKPERGKSPLQMAAAARAAAGNPGRPDGGQRPRRAV